MKLTKKQTKALDILEDKVTSELYYGGAAGGGKSVLGSYWCIKSSLKYPGSRWLMGRSELKTLKKTTLMTFFEICKICGLTAGMEYKLNEQTNIITWANGSQIILADLFAYPSDPEFDSLGSLEITGAFVDEAPQVTEKAKNILKSRIRFKIDEFGLIPKLLMAGNPSKGWAYYEFYQPSKEGRLRKDRKFIQALVTDNPMISKHYIESLRGLDENSKQRLLFGNWEYDDDPAALITYENILKCFENRQAEGEKYLTCDVARFGSDKTVIGIWNGWNVQLEVHKGLKVTEVAERLKQLQVIHGVINSNTIADEDGIGSGVVDTLMCKGFVNNSKPLANPVKNYGNVNHKGRQLEENFSNLKSQCYFRLAERINKGGLFIDCNNVDIKKDIIQELEQVKQYKMDKDGKRQVLPKDKVKEVIGRSPDFADTLMMREYFDLKPAYQVRVW